MTIQRSTEDQLAEYRAVLKSALDPMITIGLDGIIRVASDSVERVFGWTPEEMVGRNVAMIMPEPHCSKHDGYLDAYRRTRDTNILNRTREFDAVRRDGSTFPIEISVSRVERPDEPLFTGIIRDVTERKRVDAELRLLYSITFAVATAGNLHDALLSALRNVGETTGWEYGEAWIPTFDDDGTPELRDTSVWYTRSESREGFEAMTHDIRFRIGEGLPGRVWASREPEWRDDLTDDRVFLRAKRTAMIGLRSGLAVPILSSDEVVAVFVFFSMRQRTEDLRLTKLVTTALAPFGPVVERKRLVDELAKHHDHLEEIVHTRTEELEKSHAQLRQADRLASIGTLAAGLGHDMNNVLLPIRARLDVLEEMTGTSDRTTANLEAIRTSIEYLQQLADGLHLLSRDPGGDPGGDSGGNPGFEITFIPEWWKKVKPLLARALPKNVTLETQIDRGLPHVAAASHHLTQAVLNLIVNAGEAIAESGVVRVVATCHDPQFVRLSVEDDGYGMSKDVLDLALDPFFTTKKRGLGTGLGLSLVNGVVQSAGGRLTIESEVGVGTTVHVDLPIAHHDDGLCAKQPETTAFVRIGDPRIRSLVEMLLGGAHATIADSPIETSPLWIVDGSDASVDACSGDRGNKTLQHIIVLGSQDERWQHIDANFIDPGNFDQLRKAIGAALRAITENTA